MITLQTEKGNETFADLSSLLKGHPEIDEACLVYTFNSAYEVTQYDGTTFHIHGDTIDWEYSFIGSRTSNEDESVDALARFAEGYDEWDYADLFLEGTSLIGFQNGYDPNSSEYPDQDWPSKTEVGSLLVTDVVLPSGKEVKIP